MTPRTVGLTRAHDEYILRVLEGRKVTHFYSSEFYGEHVSKALSAIDRRVDPARDRFPVSATAIRADAYRHRHLVSPRVYRDLVTNVVFLGAPSTGKTTLCEKLAAAFNTVWVPEYGREYWEEHQVDRRLTPAQLVEIAEGHIALEEERLLEANRYVFTDTNALTTLLFARHYHGSAEPRLEELAEQTASRYGVTFLCGDEIPYDGTWDRSGEVNRADMQRWTVEELEQRGIDHSLLTGSFDERMDLVMRTLGARIKKPASPDI
jgi:HTH-type transcriptional regulator, transcriptional repressor of NAD biosynthesis genes